MRGAEVFAVQLSRALRDKGSDAKIVSLYGSAGTALPLDGVPFVDVRAGNGTAGVQLGLARQLARVLKEERPDVVQANGSDTLKYTVLSRRLFGARFPLVYRNIGMPGAWLRGPVHQAWNRGLMHSVDRIAAVCEASRQDIGARYGINGNRVVTIPIGTEIPRQLDRRRSRERLQDVAGYLGNDPVVMTVGSLSAEKNPLGMLRAFARVREATARAHLVYVGDGPLRAQLEERIADADLARCVHVLGTRNDVVELLPGADVFALFSNTEGLPAVLLEAAACRLPMIASDVGGVSEIVRPGVSGFLVQPEDEAALSRQLANLLADGDLRRSMGDAARQLARERFDLPVVVEAFIDLYDELIQDESWANGSK